MCSLTKCNEILVDRFDVIGFVFPFREERDAKGKQSLDEFFEDFNEIVSSEMKPTCDSARDSAMSAIPYNDPAVGFNLNGTGGGVDFNLDMTHFYVNANETDYLNTDDLKMDFSSGLIQYPAADQFAYKDDHGHYTVMDLTNVVTSSKMMHGTGANFGQTTMVMDNHPVDYSIIDHSTHTKQVADYLDAKISVTTPLNQFYLDFKLNGDALGTVNDDNSIVTYISKDSLQSVEYINENGQTQTVMYVDNQQQQPGGIQGGTNGSGMTQYEIINIDEYPYPDANAANVQMPRTNAAELVQSNGSGAVPYYNDNIHITQHTDILTTLLSDRNNKITIISKPMKNPKVRPSESDEVFKKFEQIDNNPTNIAFAKPSKVRRGRKERHGAINQIEMEIVEPKPIRPKIKPKIILPAPTTAIPETPKLPSKFMKDRRNRTQVIRKRPRKLYWDSESDSESVVKFGIKCSS